MTKLKNLLLLSSINWPVRAQLTCEGTVREQLTCVGTTDLWGYSEGTTDLSYCQYKQNDVSRGNRIWLHQWIWIYSCKTWLIYIITNIDKSKAANIVSRQRYILFSKIILTIATVVAFIVATAVIIMIVLNKSNIKTVGELNPLIHKGLALFITL